MMAMRKSLLILAALPLYFVPAQAQFIGVPGAGGGAGCTVSGSATQVVTDNGLSGCLSNPAFLYTGGAITLGTAGSVVGAINLKNATSGTINVLPPTGALGTPSLVWPIFSGTLALSGGVTIMTTSQSPTAAIWATFPTYVVNAGSLLITIPLSTTLNTNSGIAVSAMNAFTLTPNASDAVCAPSCGSNGVGLSIGANQLVYVTTDGANHIYVTNASASGLANPITVAVSDTYAGAASTAALIFSGATYASGTGTTTFPTLFLQPTGTTAATDWNTAGTLLGINGAGSSDLIVAKNAGTTEFSVDSGGHINGRAGFDVTNPSGYYQIGSKAYWSSPADGQFEIQDNAATGNILIQGGGATASFPGFKRSTTGWLVRLADDSANTWIQGSYLKTNTTTVAGLPAAATAGAGAIAYVTDAVACTFLATLTGGGSTGCPVVSNGTSWTAG